MIVEHAFITTLTQDEARQASVGLLSLAGFAAAEDDGPAWVAMSRGKTKRAVGPAEIRHRVRLEFDRHRISVGVSVELQRSPHRLNEAMATGIALALERHLVEGVEAEAALVEWREAFAKAAEKTRKMRRNNRIAFGSLIAILVLLVGFIVFAATR